MKYIIEIPVDAQYIMINGMRERCCYTQTKNVADLEELNSDYISEHYGSLQDDVWEAAKKIFGDVDFGGLTLNALNEIFGTKNYSYILQGNTAQEAITKLKAYEAGKQTDRIEVGDEVNTRDGAPSHTFLVTKVTHGHVYGISNDGSWNYYTKDSVTKTGKHYDIASILEAMQK